MTKTQKDSNNSQQQQSRLAQQQPEVFPVREHLVQPSLRCPKMGYMCWKWHNRSCLTFDDWNTVTSCEVWCPTAGPPLFECSKAVIFAVWTPAAPGDCIPSEPHQKTLPTARRGYTRPAHGHKHTNGCQSLPSYHVSKQVHTGELFCHLNQSDSMHALICPVVSPGPGPEMRKPHVPYHLQRTVSSHWCSTSKMWWNPYGGQLHQTVATTDTKKKRKDDGASVI